MILNMLPWIPTSLGVLAYTFSNFLAMLLIKGQAKPFKPWVTRIWAWVYNLILVVAFAAYPTTLLVSFYPCFEQDRHVCRPSLNVEWTNMYGLIDTRGTRQSSKQQDHRTWAGNVRLA